MLGSAVLALGTLAFFHSAYSTWEVVSIRKGLGVSRSIPEDIVLELFVSLALLLVGVCLTAAPLKRITWASELQKRSIDEIDSRPGFIRLNHRGAFMFGES